MIQGQPQDLTLRRLLVWAQDPTHRLRILAQLIDSIHGQKGGVLLSTLESFTSHGNPNVSQFTKHIVAHVNIISF